MAKVMIVDDDRNMVSLLKILLEMDGFEVVNISQVVEFIDKVRTEELDIVLLDVVMSNIDGKELMVELRNTEDVQATKVVMTSGMDLEEQCKKAGADDFLLKPYTPEQLMNIIQKNMHTKRCLKQNHAHFLLNFY